MAGLRYHMIRLALEAIAGLGLDRVLASRTRGRGVILTFHHVRPDALSRLPENAGLSITPDFLEAVILLLRRLDYEIIPLDALAARLVDPAPASARPIAVLTFDDGYRDNRDFALPVLRRHGAPFTLFACPGFAERTAPLWWLDLDEAVLKLERIRLELPGGDFEARATDPASKFALLRRLYWRLRECDEPTLQAAVIRLAREAGVDQAARIAALCMDWAELRDFAAEPLATIGAHTLSHPRLAKLGEDEARVEIAGSRDRILAELGIDARHFAYPVGDPGSAGPRDYALAREAGFTTAVTTVPGVLKPGVAPHALPRLSANGLFQQERYLRALISGVPFMLKS